jgi:16S rRNA (cytidine1402-2'-O)-methyltransferase
MPVFTGMFQGVLPPPAQAASRNKKEHAKKTCAALDIFAYNAVMKMTPSGGSTNLNESRPQGLYIIATPIGNMGDISLRAIETLRKIDVIACEDTRETGKLCAAYAFTAGRIPYHDHNAAYMRPKIIEMMREGKSVALVSDAGMPLISDPGYKLVEACVAEGLPVTCVPGASASLVALVLSGLPADRFFFSGFLPPKTSARKTALREIATVPATLIFYETAPRLISSLKDMHDTLGDRPAAVARELTKKFEEVRRGNLSDLAAHYEEHGPPKGEIVVVVGAPLVQEKIHDIEALLKDALKHMSIKDAAAFVAQQTGGRKKDIYAHALALKEEDA